MLVFLFPSDTFTHSFHRCSLLKFHILSFPFVLQEKHLLKKIKVEALTLTAALLKVGLHDSKYI